MKRQTIVYTSGVFDLFHIGHLRILASAKAIGDKLIVGVSTDELCVRHKGRAPVIPFSERMEIVSSIKYVDVCIAQHDRDKVAAWQKLKFDVLVVGDDWYGKEEFQEYDKKLSELGVRLFYFPYDRTTSSSKRRHLLGSA